MPPENAKDPEISSDIKSMTQNFHNVLIRKLSDRLPPPTGKYYLTEFFISVRPQTRNLYLMPHAKLEEVRKQVTELLEYGFR